MNKFFFIFLFLFSVCIYSYAQDIETPETDSLPTDVSSEKHNYRFGIASYYASKFVGRRTANGEIYQHELYTAACNVLPLNTWIRVTNLKNNKSVIVKINDRLHPKNKRLVDLSYIAAKELGYIKRGLSKVKIEVLENYVFFGRKH